MCIRDSCIVRSNQEIFFDEQKTKKGIVTSGTYSPTLKKSIALARITPSDREKCLAEVRGKIFTAAIGHPRFVKEGKIVF